MQPTNYIPKAGPVQERISAREWVHELDKYGENLETEKRNWDQDYRQNENNNVLDLTGDTMVQEKILTQLNRETRRIYIAGCGARTHLQKAILSSFPSADIVCGDISRHALKLAMSSLTDSRVEYRLEDSTRLSFKDDCFEVVIVVNSVLSLDAISRKMLSEFHRILIPETGKLVGCFPTVNCGFELIHLSPALSYMLTDGSINYAKNSVWEHHQAVEQTFYSPIRLKNVINESGFKKMEMSYIFLDSDYFYKQYDDLYKGLFNKKNGLCIYENFVVATAA